MKGQIRYAANGDRTYFIEGTEVTEDVYRVICWRDKEKMKDMLEDGRAPHGISDCTFMKGTANGRQFEGQQKQGNYYRHIAELHGGNTNGKKYLSGLARYPGDPEAWVDGRGDVERVLSKRGWGCEGTVNVKPRERTSEPTPGPDMADDLAETYATQIAARDPNPHLVDMEDLKCQVKEKMGKKKKAVSKATSAT